MSIRAILFDMGDTLVHYTPRDWTWRQAEEPGLDSIYWELVGLGYFARLEREQFVDTMFAHLQQGWAAASGGQANLRAADWLRAGLHALNVPENVLPNEELVALFTAPIRARVMECVDARATLEILRNEGYRMGVISNTFWPGALHRADMTMLGLHDYLEVMHFSGDLGIWKPDRRIFEQTAAAVGVKPSETLFVGNAPNEDIAGAQAAGMRTVWVEMPHERLGDIQPDAVIRQLGELPEVVKVMGDG
jgi:putative hydrolase of the HAD superfamily